MLIPKKSLGQNFLIDKNICKKIINLTLVKNKNILEIGPGYGFMTDEILLRKPKKLYLIEKDEVIFKYLQKKYENNKEVIVINADILNVNLDGYRDLIIISNLPYNISTKVILNLFNYNKNILEMIFMVQKEVAKKFDYNLPNMNKYKFMTKMFSKYSRCFDVSSQVFIPKPKVRSSVVKLILNKNTEDMMKLKNFSDTIFKNVRKKINNNINIKNSKSYLLNKRVNQLTIKELLQIYNFV